MKKLFGLFSIALIFTLGFTALAMAQGITPPSGQEITAFFTSLSGVGGLKGAAIVAFVVQGLLLFFRSSFSDFAGKYKLLVITGLTLAASIIAGLISGQPFLQSIMSAGSLAAAQVFIHQIGVQLGKTS